MCKGKIQHKIQPVDIYIKHNLEFAVGKEILDRLLKFHMEFENKPYKGQRSDFRAISDFFLYPVSWSFRRNTAEFSIKTLIVSTQLVFNQ